MATIPQTLASVVLVAAGVSLGAAGSFAQDLGPVTALPTPASVPAQPAGVTLRQLSFAGSGCPATTVTGTFPTDATTFFLSLSSFAANAGAGVPLLNGRKNCQILLDLDYPTGWQYTVQSVEYTGHATVDGASTATAGSAYYFQGDTSTVRFGTVFDGPADRDFDVTDAVSGSGQLWSACDATRALNLNLEIRVTSQAGGQATGSVTFGSVNTGAAGTLLALAWRQCP